MNEIWKTIDEYPDYMISSMGRVKSLKFGKEKLLKPFIQRKGYYLVELRNNNKTKTFTIHKLVAIHFLPNPNNLQQINHINENKLDNRVENLEWCTNEYNINYGTRNKRISKKLKKEVLQYDKDMILLKEWDSIKSIKNELGFDESCISRCCNNHINSSYGYIWKYKEDNDYKLCG